VHNVSLPKHLYGFVREWALYDGDESKTGMIPAVIHGISSTPSRSLGFHALLENGARWSDLPLHALAHKQGAPELPLEELSLFDAFGYDITVTEYEYLRELEVEAKLRSGRKELGVYVLSLDWIRNGWSDFPAQHKELHLIALDSGGFAVLPNYNCRFREASFVDPTQPLPPYRAQSTVWHSEWGFHMSPENKVVEE
jgi:hypothetical protein